MYTKIAICCIAAAIAVFILVAKNPDSQSFTRGWTLFFTGMAAGILLLLGGITFTVIAVIKERTILSWVCAAIFILTFITITISIILSSSYGANYRARRIQKETERAAANPEINEHSMIVHITRGNNEPVQRHLLKHGVETSDRMGNTPMMIAAICGNNDLLKWLIEQKANVNAQNMQGYTALHMSCSSGNAEYIQILLEHGANPNPVTIDGNTAAHVLAGKWKGDESLFILKKLYRYGADFSIKNNAGQSVTDMLSKDILNQLSEK